MKKRILNSLDKLGRKIFEFIVGFFDVLPIILLLAVVGFIISFAIISPVIDGINTVVEHENNLEIDSAHWKIRSGDKNYLRFSYITSCAIKEEDEESGLILVTCTDRNTDNVAIYVATSVRFYGE